MLGCSTTISFPTPISSWEDEIPPPPSNSRRRRRRRPNSGAPSPPPLLLLLLPSGQQPEQSFLPSVSFFPLFHLLAPVSPAVDTGWLRKGRIKFDEKPELSYKSVVISIVCLTRKPRDTHSQINSSVFAARETKYQAYTINKSTRHSLASHDCFFRISCFVHPVLFFLHLLLLPFPPLL